MREKLTTTEARSGQTTGRMRYVLGLSLLGSVVALGVVYLVFFA
ncbi:MAG: hypothetical protein AB7M05_18560 [Alphaproteobacteria bacterium]